MDNTYTIIPDFMLDYDLNMTETVALAVIYGFCQDGKSDFHGSYSYLARKCKCSRQWAIELVASLVKKGYVSKRIKEINGVKVCHLRTESDSQESLLPVKKVDGGSQESLPNNIVRENIEDTKEKERDIYISQKKFNFLSSLIAIGVSRETATDWLQVRKTKRLTNTKIAFDNIAKEITKSGRSAEDCIRLAVENSWGGFKAEWMPPAPYKMWEGTMDEYLKAKGYVTDN